MPPQQQLTNPPLRLPPCLRQPRPPAAGVPAQLEPQQVPVLPLAPRRPLPPPTAALQRLPQQLALH